MKKIITGILSLMSVVSVAATDPTPNPYGLSPGKADIKSAGALAFGPDGILFVADSKAASVFAFDVKDNEKDTTSTAIEINNIDRAIAAFLGISPEAIMINDMVIHPGSQNVYLSVSRGRSVDALPVIIRVNRKKEISEVKVDNILFSQAPIHNAPGVDDKTSWGAPKRPMAITDIAFYDGTLYVAGLSNEEFSSSLRRLSFPFNASEKVNTTIEIFHASHNRYETHAPITTFLPLMLNKQPHILAGYGCAPLAKFSVADLKSNKHLKGSTLAELGGGSRPTDIVLFNRKGEDHVLIANSNRSVYKIKVSDLEKSQPITTPVDDIYVSSGTPFVATAFVGVLQIDDLNKNFVAAIQRDIQTGALNLVSLPKRWM